MVKRKLGALEKVDADLYGSRIWDEEQFSNHRRRPNLQHKIKRDPTCVLQKCVRHSAVDNPADHMLRTSVRNTINTRTTARYSLQRHRQGQTLALSPFATWLISSPMSQIATRQSRKISLMSSSRSSHFTMQPWNQNLGKRLWAAWFYWERKKLLIPIRGFKPSLGEVHWKLTAR